MPADGTPPGQIIPKPPQRQIEVEGRFRDIQRQCGVSALNPPHQIGEVAGHVITPVKDSDPRKTGLSQKSTEIIRRKQITRPMPGRKPSGFIGAQQTLNSGLIREDNPPTRLQDPEGFTRHPGLVAGMNRRLLTPPDIESVVSKRQGVEVYRLVVDEAAQSRPFTQSAGDRLMLGFDVGCGDADAENPARYLAVAPQPLATSRTC